MQSIIKRSENTIAKAMKELKSYELLEEERQGFGKPNKIYLLSATVHSLGIEANEYSTADFEVMDETLENQQLRNSCGMRAVNFTAQEPQNLRLYRNHNKENHNDIIHNPVLSSQSESGRQDNDMTDDTPQKIEAYYCVIKENIDYDSLRISKSYDMKLVDEFIAIIVDTALTEGKTVRIGGENKPRALVVGQLMKLTYSDIELVISQFKSVTDRISKKKHYILTMLYNSKLEGDSHYTNLVKHDMWNGGVHGD